MARLSGGSFALVSQDTKSLFFSLIARAKSRAFVLPIAAILAACFGAATLQALPLGASKPVAPAPGQAARFGAAAKAGYRAAALAPRAQAPRPSPLTPVLNHPMPGRDLDCMARAIYYEARGESPEGQAAVAQVVLNRVHHPAYPKTVCGVVFQGAVAQACQFTFACNGAMKRPLEPSAWRRAKSVAAKALGGALPPTIGDATSFHVARLDYDLKADMTRVGNHVFYIARSGRAS